jgi:voltage-gated potassium channel
MWWAFVTITTVGYGDKFPITHEGRIIAAVLMTAGVGLFGTFTAYVATFFLEAEHKKEDSELKQLLEEVRLLKAKMEAIERGLND